MDNQYKHHRGRAVLEIRRNNAVTAEATKSAKGARNPF